MPLEPKPFGHILQGIEIHRQCYAPRDNGKEVHAVGMNLPQQIQVRAIALREPIQHRRLVCSVVIDRRVLVLCHIVHKLPPHLFLPRLVRRFRKKRNILNRPSVHLKDAE